MDIYGNPAKSLYKNFDLDALKEEVKEEQLGLLARQPQDKATELGLDNQPAVRMAKHMLIVREAREKLRNTHRDKK